MYFRARTCALVLAGFAWAAEGAAADTGAEGLAATVLSAELGLSGSYALSGYSDGTYAEGIDGDDSWASSLSASPWFALDLDATYFELFGRLSANTDGKYGPALAGSGTIPGTYFTVEEGGIKSSLGALSLAAGRFRHYDVVDTPYSLFVNGRGLAAPILDIAFDDGRFFYESRWIGLNSDSDSKTEAWPTGFPSRGATIKDYGLHIGDMRIGFQDAAVYCGQAFDYEYFLNPIPMYFTQYFKGTGGTPWTEDRNDNSIIGLFWDWNRPDGLSFLAQLLVDDFNVHWLLPSTPDFPWQAAFSLGARVRTKYGRFGLFVAGATEYSFEGNQMTTEDQASNCYSYTYYPDTRFDHDWETAGYQYAPIAIEDNLIGYQYGENNIATRLEWQGRASDLELSSYFEFRLMGSNSPANTWHDGTVDPEDGTHWLEDAVLEKRFLLGLGASRKMAAWRFTGEIVAGLAIDALRLRSPTDVDDSSASDADRYVWIYAPVEGQIDPIFRVKLGASYAIGVR